ncbi:uncharacterized protein LOC112216581 [Oncorhynchus tshawytscha]|uniref:DUF218 domain-containing protein n=1 Tax=Oncorhynchus tshawytscha TaxID=74940 RepID=A0AAZ3RKI0_ONCTS|nr:uncharacterized protein LOC112216581 [Oncorhynchus tshawytscha]
MTCVWPLWLLLTGYLGNQTAGQQDTGHFSRYFCLSLSLFLPMQENTHTHTHQRTHTVFVCYYPMSLVCVLCVPGVWTRPEADVFLDAALRMGVPSGNILLETEATNTGENIRFSYRLLKENNIPAHRVILVQRPFTERRVFATFLRQWHDQEEHTHAIVISSQMGISAYPHPTVGTATDLITCMLGVLERIRDNPQKGFQVEQEIQDSLSRTGLSLPTNGSCTLATFPSECTTHTPMHERLHTLPRTHTCPYVLLC